MSLSYSTNEKTDIKEGKIAKEKISVYTSSAKQSWWMRYTYILVLVPHKTETKIYHEYTEYSPLWLHKILKCYFTSLKKILLNKLFLFINEHYTDTLDHFH
jgi:hypothetical protein